MAHTYKQAPKGGKATNRGIENISFTAAFILFVARLMLSIFKAVFFGASAALRFFLGTRPTAGAGFAPSGTGGAPAPNPQKPEGKTVQQDAATARFPDTVFVDSGWNEPYPVAQRVHVVNLEIAAGVDAGRIFMYLYDKGDPHIRRVLRCDSNALREVMGHARYYMSDIPWDPKKGEKGLDVLKQSSVDEVLELVKARLITRKKGRASPDKSVQQPDRPAVSNVAPESHTQPELPKAEIAPIQLLQMKPQPKAAMPVLAPVANQRVERESKGDAFQGVVSELGMTARRDGERTYQSFCIKLDVNGVHTPFYGVELEREVLEHNVCAGDTVEIKFMGWQDVKGREGTFSKKLYKIRVIEKAKQ